LIDVVVTSITSTHPVSTTLARTSQHALRVDSDSFRITSIYVRHPCTKCTGVHPYQSQRRRQGPSKLWQAHEQAHGKRQPHTASCLRSRTATTCASAARARRRSRSPPSPRASGATFAGGTPGSASSSRASSGRSPTHSESACGLSGNAAGLTPRRPSDTPALRCSSATLRRRCLGSIGASRRWCLNVFY
jgi:hypothetical protein